MMSAFFMRENEELLMTGLKNQFCLAFRANLLTLQHIDVINELFDLEWVDTWVWENPSIFIILSV